MKAGVKRNNDGQAFMVYEQLTSACSGLILLRARLRRTRAASRFGPPRGTVADTDARDVSGGWNPIKPEMKAAQ